MGRFRRLEFEGPQPREAARAEETVGPELYLERAEREYWEGNFENALRWYSRALEGDRLLLRAWQRQVVMLVELREYDEAALWADKAMELFPDDPELLASKAVALCRRGDVIGALLAVDKAIRLPGASPERWVARGEVLLARREGNQEYCFSKAISEAPGDWLVQMQIGRVYDFYGLRSKALEHYRRALDLEPGAVFVLLQTARCEKELGLEWRARRTLEEVLQLRPGHLEAGRELLALKTGGFWHSLRGFLRGLFGR